MKNFDEFKGYIYRLDFDPVSKSFVPHKLEPVLPPQNDQSAPASATAATEPADFQILKLRKKAHALQSAKSPKAMRSRTCISFRKILPR